MSFYSVFKSVVSVLSIIMLNRTLSCSLTPVSFITHCE